MKAKKAAALFLIFLFLLTGAGCTYSKEEAETTLTTEMSSATTEETTTEAADTEKPDSDAESSDTESSDKTASEDESTAAAEKDESSSEDEENVTAETDDTVNEITTEKTSASTTKKKSLEISTIVNLSSLVDIKSYTKSTTSKPAETTKATTTEKKAEKQGEKFFNDVVFVGDSVTLGLKNYVTSERNSGRSCLGKAQFLCAGSLGYVNSYNGVLEPTYQGNKVRIEDGIKQSGAKKAFIMLGMNDFSGYASSSIDKAIRGTLDNIIKKNPNVKIYIESVTPILKSKQHDEFTNANVNAFNKKLKSICTEYELTYVDINSVMKDSDGCLNPDYCGDASSMGIHMSYPGCKAWVKYLVNNF